MSTTPASSPRPKPERSFSLNKFRGALRRGSKSSADGGANSSPEPSEGRPSIDSANGGTPPSTPPPNVTAIPHTISAATSPRKPSSLRRMSLDVVRSGRHGRSQSVSVVPPAGTSSASTSSTAVASNGTTTESKDTKESAKEEFDPFSESHDDKSKSRGWRATVKGALKRTASRLSVSSAHSTGKPASAEKEASRNGEAVTVVAPPVSPPLEATAVTAEPISAEPASFEDTKDEPETTTTNAEPIPQSKPAEVAEDPKVEKEEPKGLEEVRPTTPAVPLEASTSLDWEHVDTADAERSDPPTPSAPKSTPAVAATPAVEVTPAVAQPEEVEGEEDPAEAKLAPLDISSSHLHVLRSEITALSPIIESPLTARDDGDMGFMVPIHEATTAIQRSSETPAITVNTVEAKTPEVKVQSTSIEESYIEVVPHLSEAAEAAEDADIANATSSTPLLSRSTAAAYSDAAVSSPDALSSTLKAVAVDVTPTNLAPSASTNTAPAASPALNAIELGDGVEPSGATKKEASSSHANGTANGTSGSQDASSNTASSSSEVPQASAISFITNTAWFVGACVVVGIGMVVGQVRSYRQVQRRSTYSSYFARVRRWFRL